MDTKELVKKYWFVGLVALILVAFIGLYAVDTVKNKPVTVKNKKVDEKYVAYSIDDTDVMADNLFKTLREANGAQVSFVALQRAVFDKAYPTTQEMKDEAAANSASIIAYYGEDYVKNILFNMGYVNGTEDLSQYYIDSQKQNMLLKDYCLANTDEFVSSEIGTNGRLIYHILVKVADVEEVKDPHGNPASYIPHPTEEETSKLNTVLEALKEGMFEQVAYQYSEDTGSAQNGGYIGVVNEENSSRFDVAFAKESMRLGDGEVSEPICSQFGYHIIYDAGSAPEAMLEDFYFIQNLETNTPTLVVKAIMDKANELQFDIIAEDLQNFINLQLGSEEN